MCIFTYCFPGAFIQKVVCLVQINTALAGWFTERQSEKPAVPIAFLMKTKKSERWNIHSSIKCVKIKNSHLLLLLASPWNRCFDSRIAPAEARRSKRELRAVQSLLICVISLYKMCTCTNKQEHTYFDPHTKMLQQCACLWEGMQWKGCNPELVFGLVHGV